MITADTITDEQLREAWDWLTESLTACEVASRAAAGKQTRFLTPEHLAWCRARCAEILNARIESRRCAKCGALCDHATWDGTNCPWCRNARARALGTTDHDGSLICDCSKCRAAFPARENTDAVRDANRATEAK
jgi:hypothetical protein